VVARGTGGGPLAAAEQGPAGLEDELVDAALGVVDGLVDAGDLLVEEDVARDAPLDGVEALVIGLAERLEGAHEVLEGGRDLRAARGFRVGSRGRLGRGRGLLGGSVHRGSPRLTGLLRNPVLAAGAAFWAVAFIGVLLV
jgi:hypothetical protein